MTFGYRWLLAERSSLKKLLADVPPEDVLDRASLESRLELTEERLRAQKGVPDLKGEGVEE